MIKKPCAKNRSLNIRVPKTIFCIRPSQKPSPKTTLFGSGFFCPDFLGTVLRIRFFGSWLSGQGFLDTVFFGSGFRIRFFGYGCLGLRIGILWCKNHILPPRQPCPKNRIPKTRAEETVSKKPCPESQDPKNRIRKTVPRKSGKKPDPKREWFLVGGFLDFPARASDLRTVFLASDFWGTVFLASDFWAGFFGLGFLNFGFWNTVFGLRGYGIGFVGHGFLDRDTVFRDSC